MDREQIIKALECCCDGWCIRDGCPLHKDEDDNINKCTSELSKNALSLIKELTEESRIANGEAYAYKLHCNRLEQQVKTLSELLDKAYDAQSSLSEENDKLVEAGFDTVDYAIDKIRQVKADTVREMRERLREAPIKVGLPLFGLQTKDEIEDYANELILQMRDAIDQIAKEMLDEG